MCGIAGQVVGDGSAVDGDLVRRMTRALAHRGPDGESVRLGPQHGLGHRRLSLIDLEGGGQPQANEDGTVWVVSNSEIYNYVELRRALVARGHRFATSSDTEVIVHLYEDLQERCVDPLVGMFAFAVWDMRRRVLLLARDRFGVKPLYYSVRGSELLFASEMRALLESPTLRRDLDYGALHQYFLHLTVPEPASILADVRKLPAGHVLVWRNGHADERAYWDVTAPTPEGDALDHALDDAFYDALDEAGAIERLDAALAESVDLSLRSDVPVGLFLSGGVDSSLLAWMASRNATAPLQTFSAAFEDHQSDERAFSRMVARACGTTHHEVEITLRDAVDILPALCGALDEPFADSSAIPTYLLARAARRQVKAVLTGEGADELFGGSPWHVGGARSADPYGLLNPPAKTIFTPDDLKAVYSDDLWDAVSRCEAPMPPGLDAKLARCPGRFEQGLCADLHVYLPSDLLMKTDRMTMLASLEARVPFLNHPFAELAWRLPSRFKVKDSVRKYILKKLGAGRLPEPVLSRPKQGFSIPMDLWLWRPGAFRDMVLDTLGDARTRARGQFDMTVVDTMVREHDRIERFHGYRLWTLFAFETWQRTFVDAPVTAS
ncbi:MAG: asparagine synthase (glutamine-hydrolyzing) [Vicinamibacterales bacterium]